MNPLDVEFQKAVIDQASSRIMLIIRALAKQLMAHGYVITDRQFDDDAEFAAWFVDYANRGSLDFLPAVNMKLYKELTERFQKVSAELMGVA